MKFLKKSILFVILLAAVIYLSFPYWSGWVLNNNLPDNVSLQSLDSSYPGLKKHHINQLVLSTDEGVIFIDDLDYDYQLNNIIISSLYYVVSNKDNADKETLFDVSNALKDFTFLRMLNNVTIQNLRLKINNEDIIFSNVELKRIDNAVLKLTSDIDEIFAQSTTSLTLNSILTLSDKDLGLLLNIDLRSSDVIDIETENQQIGFSAFNINIKTDLVIEPENKKSQLLFLSDTTFNFITTQLQINNKNAEQKYHINDFEFKGDIPKSQLNVEHFLQSHFLLQGDVKANALLVIKQSEADDVEISSNLDMRINIVNKGKWVSHGHLLLTELKLPGFENKLNKNIEINWSELKSKDQHIMAQGKILLNEQFLTPFEVYYNHAISELKFDVQNNNLSLAMINQIIDLYDQNNTLTLSMLSGDVEHALHLNSSEQFSISSHLLVNNAELQIYKNSLSGVNLEQTLTAMTPLKFESALSAESIALSGGLVLNNFSSKITANDEQFIEVSAITAELLQGTLTSKKVVIVNEGFKPATFTLKSISLIDLMLLIDISGLYAEGKLDMTVPMEMNKDVVTVKDGKFSAVAKGLIQYTSGDDKTSEENIALKALENFHYKELDGEFSYNDNGEYKIKLHLLGSNPDLYDGYPVDFTLNINGTLSGIFRSLFLTGDFEQAVLETIKATETEKLKN